MNTSWEVSIPRVYDSAVAARATTARLGDNPAVASRLASGLSQGSGAPPLPAAGNNGAQYYDYTNFRLYRSDGVGWYIISEPEQTATALCITGVSVDGALTSKTSYHRSDGYIDVESITVFGSGPSTLASLAWTPPIAGRTAAGSLPIGIGWGSLLVAFFNNTSGGWVQGTNDQGTTSIPLFALLTSGTDAGIHAPSTTVPHSWAANFAIRITGRYPMTTRYS